MDNKIKVNIDPQEVEAAFQAVAESFQSMLPSLENAFNHFFHHNILINDFSFRGSLELELFLVSDSEIKKINNEYRDKDSPTDVISLSLFSDFRSEWPDNNLPLVNLGDVFISVDTAQKQAQEGNISLERELTELLIHGILHLMGFDHEISEKEMEIMYKKEQEIFDYYWDNKV